MPLSALWMVNPVIQHKLFPGKYTVDSQWRHLLSDSSEVKDGANVYGVDTDFDSACTAIPQDGQIIPAVVIDVIPAKVVLLGLSSKCYVRFLMIYANELHLLCFNVAIAILIKVDSHHGLFQYWMSRGRSWIYENIRVTLKVPLCVTYSMPKRVKNVPSPPASLYLTHMPRVKVFRPNVKGYAWAAIPVPSSDSKHKS